MSGERPSLAGYEEEAPALFVRYEARPVETVHRLVMPYFPPAPADVLDIGAGTGRDAAWFAQRGYRVVAAEPTAAMREGAMRLHPEPEIAWIDDALPGLEGVRALGRCFDLVMMTAVWMHLDADERVLAMEGVAALVREGGRLVLSLRHGPVPAGRRMFDVTAEETIALAGRHGLAPLFQHRRDDREQAGVAWTQLVFGRT